MTEILHIAQGKPHAEIFSPIFIDALKKFGGLALIENGQAMTNDQLAQRTRQHRVVLTGWHGMSIPNSLASDAGRLEYVCHLTGSMKGFIDLEHLKEPAAIR